MAMDWHDMLAWYDEALAIERARADVAAAPTMAFLRAMARRR